jgi:hypothetical protein
MTVSIIEFSDGLLYPPDHVGRGFAIRDGKRIKANAIDDANVQYLESFYKDNGYNVSFTKSELPINISFVQNETQANGIIVNTIITVENNETKVS